MSALLYRNEMAPPSLATFATPHGFQTGPNRLTAGTIIDISSGAGVTCLGNCANGILSRMAHQGYEVPYTHFANWTTNEAELAGQMLLDELNGTFKDGGVSFFSGGAEAVEAACKIGHQYFAEIGQGTRDRAHTRLISRYPSYHGASMFTLALGAHPRKERFARMGLMTLSSSIQFPIPTDDIPEARSLAYLQEALQVAAGNKIVVIEPIAGTSAAIEPPPIGYLEAVRQICDEHDALLVYDEILCGNFRTGYLCAWQYYGVASGKFAACAPDIICMGKGLTGGYFPLSAVIVNARVAEAIRNGSGKLWHTSTNQNHPIGCAAVTAALPLYRMEVDAGITRTARYLDELDPCLLACHNIVDVSGVETLRAIRLREVGNPHKVYGNVQTQLREHGVAAYMDFGTRNGADAMMLLAPPYSIGRDELQHAASVIVQVLNAL